MKCEPNCRASSGVTGGRARRSKIRAPVFVAFGGETRFESVIGKAAALLVEEIVALFQRGEKIVEGGQIGIGCRGKPRTTH
jgi:hypothetical protein